jgi:hypothetical protein
MYHWHRMRKSTQAKEGKAKTKTVVISELAKDFVFCCYYYYYYFGGVGRNAASNPVCNTAHFTLPIRLSVSHDVHQCFCGLP